ncbi:MAG TPA: DUF5615 family PIN-like protein [Bryobacteraceae bacterium]|nr:DUF5615 family PIN-like protein [Bryobacteraceae bacterium]
MKFWLDAQLSPALAPYISERFLVEVTHVGSLGLLHATDKDIYNLAKEQQVVIITKDRDFLDLSRRFGPPPQVVWVRSGNTSNAMMRYTLDGRFADVLRLLSDGEAVVELRGQIPLEPERT